MLVSEKMKKEIVFYLERVSADFEECDDDDESYLDIRLQISESDYGSDYGSEWSIHTGSSDYDQDHRGFWGCSSISGEESTEDIIEIVEDIVEQAEEEYEQKTN